MEGAMENATENVGNLMAKLNSSIDEAMDLLDVDESIWGCEESDRISGFWELIALRCYF